MFTGAADFYDALYAFKDYPGEAARIMAILEERRVKGSLLDVGCGAGGHVASFVSRFATTGVDLDARLIELARAKVSAAEFLVADMCALELGREFDAIVCLYGSIAYTRTLGRMRGAVARLAAHLAPRGVLIVEPWYRSPDACPRMQVRHVDLPDIKIARLSATSVDDASATIDVHYLVGRDGRIEHVREEHRLGIFSDEQHIDALRSAGLDVAQSADLYIAVRR